MRRVRRIAGQRVEGLRNLGVGFAAVGAMSYPQANGVGR